jgi:DNA invertase Pin-like site-specific DNA recombinase
MLLSYTDVIVIFQHEVTKSNFVNLPFWREYLKKRPELYAMLDHLRVGDTIVVWKLDRLE